VATPADPPVLRIDVHEPSSWTDARAQAVARLAEGEVVLLPAEGLYGYHIRPDRPRGVERLQAMKPRDAGKGWVLLVDDPHALERWDAAMPSGALELAKRHWPGALTIVVPATSSIPPALRAADGTAAVRCPGSRFLREVVRDAGGLLVSTSANRPGGDPPARIADAALAGAAMAVDGGGLAGVPSTLVRVDGSTVTVLRKGAVGLAAIGADRT
jgi:tRNA threonylcarbamoyl adenosine modification protein (Sua5/YciO/YrdC/YwlC family)